MAQNQPPANIFTAAAAQVTLRQRMTDARLRLGVAAPQLSVIGELTDIAHDESELLTTLLTGINGDVQLPEQKVRVEYLADSQKLIIPYGLVMPLTAARDSEVPVNPTLANRYRRASALSYSALKRLVAAAPSYADLRATIERSPEPAADRRDIPWVSTTYYQDEPGVTDSPEDITLTFTFLSRALQFNMDIRDVGALLAGNMRFNDDSWNHHTDYPRTRLNSRLRPWTLQCIAALNLLPCANVQLGAWVRAYALSAGVLQSPASVSNKEYMFSLAQPVKANLDLITTYERDTTTNLHALSLNIVAMFGILHLSKDHTYKSNDANMMRICTSFIMALRTMVPELLLDQMKGSMEVICRTAVHPFGLAQTYCVARIMKATQTLAPALALRTTATPPTVQRIMIVKSASDEWMNLPVGAKMNELYRENITHVTRQYNAIRANPPAYSSLHRLYGIDRMEEIPTEAKAAADSLMPLIYGFAMAMHSVDEKDKDGVALAMSLENVKRDCRVMTNVFTNMWTNYSEGVSGEDLLKFASGAIKALQGGG